MADVSYLTIDHAPNKTTYVAGDKFERYGMVVTAHYTDGTTSTVDFFAYSPTSSLTINNTQITISVLDKTVTQNITVLPVPAKGYFVDKYLGNANYGNNPFINAVDGSISFYNNPITVERDSYTISLILSYHSRMTDGESDLIKGLFKGFRTNFHQFLINDGIDENNNALYKYIDGDGYIHTFIYNSDISKYYDKEGACLFLEINNNNKTIIDQQNNVLSFDSSGRLISIQSGLDSNNVKIIEYNSDGLRKIYDNRNPNVYIKFSYNFSFLQYIRIYYNNNNSPLKTYTLNGMFGQISSIEETVGNSTRTLYQYAVNDRDRVRRIVDCLTKVAYRITYTFDAFLNDYRFESLRKGYLNNDTFIQHEGLYFENYCYDAGSSYKFMHELFVKNDNDIILSLMTDSNANPVSIFEKDYDSDNDYYSLIHDEGIWLANEGNSGDRISDSTSKPFSGVLNVNNISISSTDLGGSKNVKLVGYLKIKDYTNRAKLRAESVNFECHYIDVNADAYYVWQYFELDIERMLDGNNNPKPFQSFNICLENENNQGINAEIANLQLTISKPNLKLYFLNGNHKACFDEIVAVRLYSSYYDYSLISDDSSPFFMSQTDLLTTIKNYYKDTANHKKAYFNGGKVVKEYYPVIVGVTQNTTIPFFNSLYVSNDILGENNNWFFAASETSKTKIYYRFKTDFYEIITRTKTSDSPETYEAETKRFNYNEQLILEINKYGKKIKYEYFTDGRLKKKGVVSQDESSYENVLFESQLDENNKYIHRTSQEGKSFDYLYDKYLLQKRLVNDLSDNPSLNHFFTIEQSYDNYLANLANVVFKNVDSIEEEHNYSRPSVSYKTNYVDDSVSKYRINQNISNQTKIIGVYDENNYVDILTIQKTNSSIVKTYNNSYSYGGGMQQVENVYDIYGRLSQILYDEMTQVSFQYDNHHASNYCSLLTGVVDNFSGRNTLYSYNSINELISIQVDDFKTSYSIDNDDYNCIEVEFTSSEKYIFKTKDRETFVQKGNNKIKSTCWIYDYDALGRLSTKNNNKFDHNVFQNYSYSNNYPSRIVSYNYDGNLYQETYSYSQFYGHLSGINISSTILSNVVTYQYDGFGRLVGETNSKLGINRTYLYKPSSSIPGPVGRMTKFGNKELVYDNRGRLIEFGDNSYGYDEYGNRISKNADSYQWTRGHLLFCLGFSRFYYDYREIRTSKLDSNGYTHNYYYEGNKLVGEDVFNGNNLVWKLRFFYDKDGLCAFRIIAGGVFKDYTYIRNPLNDIVGICDGTTPVALYVYDAWGNHKVYDQHGTINTDLSFIGNINPIRYRSYYYDSDTGLYYLESRYYDPEIGQFISPDDVDNVDFNNIAGINLYAYCHYNPAEYYDSNGHIATEIIVGLIVGIVIGVSVGFGTAAYIDYQNDGMLFNWGDNDPKWYDYLGAIVLGGVVGGILGVGAGYLSTMSFPLGIPVFHMTTKGGLIAIETTFVGATLSGSAIVSAAVSAGALAGICFFAKGFGSRMGHNQYENKQIDDLCRKHHLTADERERLHREISHQNYTLKEIEEIIWDLFHK